MSIREWHEAMKDKSRHGYTVNTTSTVRIFREYSMNRNGEKFALGMVDLVGMKGVEIEEDATPKSAMSRLWGCQMYV